MVLGNRKNIICIISLSISVPLVAIYRKCRFNLGRVELKLRRQMPAGAPRVRRWCNTTLSSPQKSYILGLDYNSIVRQCYSLIIDVSSPVVCNPIGTAGTRRCWPYFPPAQTCFPFLSLCSSYTKLFKTYIGNNNCWKAILLGISYLLGVTFPGVYLIKINTGVYTPGTFGLYEKLWHVVLEDNKVIWALRWMCERPRCKYDNCTTTIFWIICFLLSHDIWYNNLLSIKFTKQSIKDIHIY